MDTKNKENEQVHNLHWQAAFGTTAASASSANTAASMLLGFTPRPVPCPDLGPGTGLGVDLQLSM